MLSIVLASQQYQASYEIQGASPVAVSATVFSLRQALNEVQ